MQSVKKIGLMISLLSVLALAEDGDVHGRDGSQPWGHIGIETSSKIYEMDMFTTTTAPISEEESHLLKNSISNFKQIGFDTVGREYWGSKYSSELKSKKRKELANKVKEFYGIGAEYTVCNDADDFEDPIYKNNEYILGKFRCDGFSWRVLNLAGVLDVMNDLTPSKVFNTLNKRRNKLEKAPSLAQKAKQEMGSYDYNSPDFWNWFFEERGAF